MSYASVDTRNTIGVRQVYPSRGLGVHRAPAETPPVSAYFPTRPLSGVRDYNTQSATRRLGAELPVSNASLFSGHIMSPVIARRSGGGTPNVFHPGQASASQTPTTTAPPPSAAGSSAQAGTPVPFNWPIAQAYTDQSGNIWTYSSVDGWTVTGEVPTTANQDGPTPTTYRMQPWPGSISLNPNGPAAQTSQAGTPVPVGYPTNQAYTDSNGDIWTYSPTYGWQATGQIAPTASAAASAAAAAAGTTAGAGTSVTVSSPDAWASLTAWLQSSSFSLGTFAVPNFFLVAGVGLIGIWLYSGSSGGRR